MEVSTHPSPATRAALLGLVLLVGAALRFSRLDEAGLDEDQAVTLSWLASPSVGDMLRAIAADLVSQPLYPLLVRGWGELRGGGVRGLRELSALVGLAAVAFSPLLLRRRPMPGLLLAAYVAVLPIHVQFSQRIRAYALVLLVATVQLALFRLPRAGSKRHGILLAAITSAGMYTHVLFSLLVLGEVLVLVARRRSHSVRPTLLALLTGVLSFLPWALASIYYRVNSVSAHVGWIPRPEPGRMAGIVARLTAGVIPESGTAWVLVWLLAIVPVVLAGREVVRFAVRRAQDERLLLLLFGGPLVLALAASALSPLSLAVDRYLLALLPAISLAVVRGLWRTGPWMRWFLAAVLLTACIALTFGSPPAVGAYEP